MTITIPITKARETLTKLPKKLDHKNTAAITRDGEPIMAILPWDLYESIIETLEITADKDLMIALRESLEDIKKNKTFSIDEIRKDIGL